MVWIVGGVFLQTEGFTSLSTMWPALLFHAVTTGLGTYFVGKPAKPQPAT